MSVPQTDRFTIAQILRPQGGEAGAAPAPRTFAIADVLHPTGGVSADEVAVPIHDATIAAPQDAPATA